MMIPSSDRLKELADQGFRRVPVASVVLADMETPLSCYLKLAAGPYSYLLESVQGGAQWGRFSMIGLPCRERIECNHGTMRRFQNNQVVETCQPESPLDWVAEYQTSLAVAPPSAVPELDLPKFTGGLVGHFAYDTVAMVEPRIAASLPADPGLDTPEILLLLSEEVAVFDNLSGRLYVITHIDPAAPDARIQAESRLRILNDKLQRALPASTFDSPVFDPITEGDFVSEFGADGYRAAVDTVKQYITAGDCMQVVPSQRMSLPFQAPPLNLYRALRRLNPSPYMYFVDCADFHIVGSSPEILARFEDGLVTVRPIAGTRQRGANELEDQALEADLLSDAKELAEHLMLIDLGRNDVGRVAQQGTIKVTDQMVVERYSHVMHIVSNVTGKALESLTAIDVLKACLPAGTLSGAPKVRAMEIINELEPSRRGIYGGAVGYLGWEGNMDTAIAIRTAILKDQQLHVQAGAGVVADSDPESEWQETLKKCRAVFRAASMAHAGLKESE